MLGPERDAVCEVVYSRQGGPWVGTFDGSID